MSRQNAERIGLLKLMVPELFAEAGTCLYVGAYGRRFAGSQPLYEAGLELTVLEIWEPFLDQLMASRYRHRVKHPILGDVCDVRELELPHREYDHTVWLHGPEHVERDKALHAIANLEAITRGAIVLGCPWGMAPHGVAFDNPHTEHLSHWQADDFQQLGYRVAAIGPHNKLGGHLLAWKLG